MSYNRNCVDQYCFHSCCDRYGYCPNSRSQCYYYYNNSGYYFNSLSHGARLGLIIGLSVLGAIILAVVIFCILRCRKRPVVIPPDNQVVYDQAYITDAPVNGPYPQVYSNEAFPHGMNDNQVHNYYQQNYPVRNY